MTGQILTLVYLFFSQIIPDFKFKKCQLQKVEKLFYIYKNRVLLLTFRC